MQYVGEIKVKNIHVQLLSDGDTYSYNIYVDDKLYGNNKGWTSLGEMLEIITGDKICKVILSKQVIKCSRVEFETSLNFKEGFEIGFNFDYLLKMPSGKMYYSDGTSPVKIENNKQLAVIMPMKV